MNTFEDWWSACSMHPVQWCTVLVKQLRSVDDGVKAKERVLLHHALAESFYALEADAAHVEDLAKFQYSVTLETGEMLLGLNMKPEDVPVMHRHPMTNQKSWAGAYLLEKMRQCLNMQASTVTKFMAAASLDTFCVFYHEDGTEEALPADSLIEFLAYKPTHAHTTYSVRPADISKWRKLPEYQTIRNRPMDKLDMWGFFCKGNPDLTNYMIKRGAMLQLQDEVP